MQRQKIPIFAKTTDFIIPMNCSPAYTIAIGGPAGRPMMSMMMVMHSLKGRV